MTDTQIEFSIAGIGHEIKSRQLAVPIYQRSFAWTGEQVQEFVDDLNEAFQSDPQEYFLGTIVLAKGDDGKDQIIDGQQRLATASLLLCALRDKYRAESEENRANDLHTKFLASYDDLADENEPRLELNSEDDHFYSRRFVDNDEAAKPDRSSHQDLLVAYETLSEFVSEVATSAGSSWITRLVQWRKFIEDRARVVSVRVPTESDAFLIFETLNDRGLDLTLADLLKNYLFGKAGNKLDLVRENWLNALATLDQDVELFITFLRHFWSSRHGQTRERDLYKAIKAEVTSTTKAVAFAKDIEASAKIYAALLNPKDTYWSKWGTSTERNLETLGRLGLEQNRPMMLAALDHFNMSEVKRTLRSTVSWSVRGLVVGGIGGGSTEKAYARAAVGIRSGELKTTRDLLDSLDSIVPSDALFEQDFAKAKVTKAPIARYMLAALENQKSGKDEPELVANSNEEVVNLEHILPKRAREADWTEFDKDQRRELLHRIGNLALLAKTPNSSIGNKPFSTKKPVLESSDLLLTKLAGEASVWDEDAIDNRQKVLATLAVQTWPREP